MIVRRPTQSVLLLVTMVSISTDFTSTANRSTSRANTPYTTNIPNVVTSTRSTREFLQRSDHYYYQTDSSYSEPTSRRTDEKQQGFNGMLIEQNGVLIYVQPTQQNTSDNDHRSHEEGGNGDGDGDGHQWGNNNNNNNNNNNDDDDVYTDDNDAYRNDDEFFEQLDCSQFQGLDDPPIECLTEGYPGGTPGYGDYNTTTGTTGDAMRPQNPETGGGAEGYPPVYGDNMTMGTEMVGTTIVNDDEVSGDNGSDSFDGYAQPGSPPENLVTLEIGVALSPPPTNLDPMNHVLSEVVTGVLDAQTSFHSVYLGNLNPPPDYRLLRQLRELAHPKQIFNQQQPGQSSRQLESHFTNDQGRPQHPPVDLIHAWTIMEPILAADDDDNNNNNNNNSNNSSTIWFRTRIQYAALIGLPENDTIVSDSVPPPRPIRRQDHIGNITVLCQSTINRTIANDALLYQLMDAIERTLEGAYSDAAWFGEQLGLVAIAPIGISGLGQPTYVDDLADRSHISYTTPLDLEFGLREWFGLGLALGTLLVTLLIFGGASYYQQLQNQKQWSTALMTEHGIDDILKVGWQYHQQEPTTMSHNGQPQLFLHVFEKQAFRSDDDSLLHGGVEREELARTGGILLVHDEGSREDESSSSNRQSSSRASAEKTQPTTQPSMDTRSKR